MPESKPITCKAAVLLEDNQPMVIEDVVIDVAKDDQVRVKMISAGICASDGHVAWGHQKAGRLPQVLGHEGLAVVESVGDNVTSIAPGDLVMTNIMSQCGTCDYCTGGKTNVCPAEGLFAMSAVANKKLASDGRPVYPFAGLGVFSEYLLLKTSQVVKVDPRLKNENACIISCAVSTGYNTATNQAKVTPDSTAAVWGLGAIGLNAVYGCKQAGAKHIIGIDTNSDKKDIALEFGCTEFINPKELDKPLDVYLKEKYAGGLDYAIECIGNKAVIETAFSCLSVYGTLALVGVDDKAVISFPLLQVLFGRKIVGGFLGNRPSSEGFIQLSQMYLDGKYPVDRLVTHRFKLEQINEAFQTLKEGKCIRSIIVFAE